MDRYADGYPEIDYTETDSTVIAALMYGTIGFRSHSDRRYTFDDISVSAQSDPIAVRDWRPVNNTNIPAVTVTVSPNPVKGAAIFSFDRLPGSGSLVIFTADGELIDMVRLDGNGKEIVWHSSADGGMYFYMVVSETIKSRGKFIIMK